MKFDKGKHHRRSLRLKGYDYAQAGAYFVTIVTRDRACLFGEIVDGESHLNSAGEMLQSTWNDRPNHCPGIECDTFVVMPNHVHGVIVLVGAGRRARLERGQPQGIAPTISLADVVHRFKTITTNRYIHGVKESGWPRFSGRFWQRNYYEHIVRNEAELARIREYIVNNPLQWENDRENPLRSDTAGAGLKPAGKIEPWEV